MAREIRFRAWDLKRKEIFFPSSVSWKDGIMWAANVFGDNRYETAIDKSELMQYTGLKDKNGKEIYEGDIVRYNELILSENDKQKDIQGADSVEIDGIGHVYWDDEGADFSIELEKTVRGFGSRGSQEIEVIGNRFENPELLK